MAISLSAFKLLVPRSKTYLFIYYLFILNIIMVYLFAVF